MEGAANGGPYWIFNYTAVWGDPVTFEPMQNVNNRCNGIDTYHDMYQKCLVDRIGHGYVSVIIASIGMILNALNILVLVSSRLRESCYVYLYGLAWADLLTLFFFLTNSIGRGHFPDSYGWNVYEIYVYFTLGSVTSFASIFLTLSVSVERFIFIYKPYKAKELCQPRIARKVMITLWTVCTLISIPRIFLFEIDKNGDVKYTEFGNSIYYRILSWIYFILFSLGACVILIALNILLIRGIRRTNTKRRSMTGKRGHKLRDDRRLTLTLISILFVFIIGELPSALVSRQLLVPMAGQDIVDTLGYRIAASVATALVVSQHSLNFVMYCVFNKRFWEVFKQRMCGCALKRVGEESSPFDQRTNTADGRVPVSVVQTNGVNGILPGSNNPSAGNVNIV